MNKRLIAGICALVSAGLLVFTAVGTNWYGKEGGRRSFHYGPVLMKECRGSDCKTEALMKDARGDAEAWAGAGLAYAGLASITGLLLVIFGIIALVGHGGKGLGITGLVFVVLTNGAAGAFAGLLPKGMSYLDTGAGIYLSSLGGAAGIAFGVLMILAGLRGPAAPPPAQGPPQAPPPRPAS
jgi:hypothetical protein